MTIRCSYCKKNNGEKCLGCGETQLRVIAAAPDVINARVEMSEIFACPTCGRTWIKGDEPETHGVCEPRCPEAVAAFEPQNRTAELEKPQG